MVLGLEKEKEKEKSSRGGSIDIFIRTASYGRTDVTETLTGTTASCGGDLACGCHVRGGVLSFLEDDGGAVG